MDEREFKLKKKKEVDEKKPAKPDNKPIIKLSINGIPPDNKPEYSYLYLI